MAPRDVRQLVDKPRAVLGRNRWLICWSISASWSEKNNGKAKLAQDTAGHGWSTLRRLAPTYGAGLQVELGNVATVQAAHSAGGDGWRQCNPGPICPNTRPAGRSDNTERRQRRATRFNRNQPSPRHPNRPTVTRTGATVTQPSPTVTTAKPCEQRLAIGPVTMVTGLQPQSNGDDSPHSDRHPTVTTAAEPSPTTTWNGYEHHC